MANVRVSWALPTTRTSGRPLAVADIDHVRLEISVDGKAFGLFDVYPPDVLETVVTEIEPGEWIFRGVVVDKKNKESAPVVGSIVIPDETPPSPLTLALALE